MGLKPEEITNSDAYKLFKLLFNSDDPQGRLDSERCVRAFFKALYEYLKEALEDQLPKDQTWDESMDQSKIKFVFSYPITWDQDTKNRFSAVIKELGYQAIGKQISTASMTSLDEAEASMLHFFSNTRETTLTRADEHVLVADVGDGTSDVSIFEVGSLKGRKANLVRVVCDEGKEIGSTQVDERFKEHVQKKLEDVYRRSFQERPSAGIQKHGDYDLELFLEKSVDAALLHVEHDPTYEDRNHQYGRGEKGKVLKKNVFELSFPDPAQSEVQAGHVDKKTFISIPIDSQDFFEDAVTDQCSKIWNQCKTQMEKLKDRQIVNHVVLAGGFGRSPYVVQKLKEEFNRYAKLQSATEPKTIQVEDAQIAVCHGLVHDELRNINKTGLWVHPVDSSCGIMKGKNKDNIRWFLKKGDMVKIPYTIDIERHVDVDYNDNDGLLDFQIVKSWLMPPRKHGLGDNEKEEWHENIADMKTGINDLVKVKNPKSVGF